MVFIFNMLNKKLFYITISFVMLANAFAKTNPTPHEQESNPSILSNTKESNNAPNDLELCVFCMLKRNVVDNQISMAYSNANANIKTLRRVLITISNKFYLERNNKITAMFIDYDKALIYSENNLILSSLITSLKNSYMNNLNAKKELTDLSNKIMSLKRELAYMHKNLRLINFKTPTNQYFPHVRARIEQISREIDDVSQKIIPPLKGLAPYE